jgi:hypothetical protein
VNAHRIAGEWLLLLRSKEGALEGRSRRAAAVADSDGLDSTESNGPHRQCPEGRNMSWCRVEAFSLEERSRCDETSSSCFSLAICFRHTCRGTHLFRASMWEWRLRNGRLSGLEKMVVMGGDGGWLCRDVRGAPARLAPRQHATLRTRNLAFFRALWRRGKPTKNSDRW